MYGSARQTGIYCQKRWNERTCMIDHLRKIVKEIGLEGARVACVPRKGRVPPRERSRYKRKIETLFEDQAARKKSKAAQLRKLATKVISRATWPS